MTWAWRRLHILFWYEVHTLILPYHLVPRLTLEILKSVPVIILLKNIYGRKSHHWTFNDNFIYLFCHGDYLFIFATCTYKCYVYRANYPILTWKDGHFFQNGGQDAHHLTYYSQHQNNLWVYATYDRAISPALHLWLLHLNGW